MMRKLGRLLLRGGALDKIPIYGPVILIVGNKISPLDTGVWGRLK